MAQNLRPRQKHKTDDKQQSKLFIAKAREIGAEDESMAAGDELMRRLAKTPAQPRTAKIKRRSTREESGE